MCYLEIHPLMRPPHVSRISQIFVGVLVLALLLPAFPVWHPLIRSGENRSALWVVSVACSHHPVCVHMGLGRESGITVYLIHKDVIKDP